MAAPAANLTLARALARAPDGVWGMLSDSARTHLLAHTRELAHLSDETHGRLSRHSVPGTHSPTWTAKLR